MPVPETQACDAGRRRVVCCRAADTHKQRCELLCTLSEYREVHGVAHLPVRRSFGWAHTANAAPDIIGFALATHRCQEAFCLWQAVATHFARVAPIELSISTTGDTRNHHVVWPEYLPRIGHNCGEVSPRRRRLLAAILEIGGGTTPAPGR